MNEGLRNTAGFVLVPMVFGAIIMGTVALIRKKRPSRWQACWVLIGLGTIGFICLWVGSVLEMPYAYTFTILKIQGAHSANGVPVSRIIKPEDGRWITDDYFIDASGLADYANLTPVRLEASNGAIYCFAYDSRTGVLVPMSPGAARHYPALLPEGDKMVNLAYLMPKEYKLQDGQVGLAFLDNDELSLPSKWFGTSVHPAFH